METNAVGLLVVTWIVQGIINSNKTEAIKRLTEEVDRLKKTVEQLGASAKP